jgi:putative tricarboxylic transport membrane protein
MLGSVLNMSDGKDMAHGPVGWWQNGDVIGGLLLAVVAAIALWMVQDLPARQGFRFASGTAPRIFAYALGLLGLAIAAQSLRSSTPHAITRPAWRPVFCIIGSLVLFSLCIRPLGLFVTGILAVIGSSFATPDVRLKETVIFAVVITAFCALIFPIALNQPVPLWPTLAMFGGH